MNPAVKELSEKDLLRNPANICGFCERSKTNSLEWGPMYKLGNICVHYFCLLFSANLSQNGEDEDGILGFLPQDINKEFNRGKKLKCCYCKLCRATVGCSIKTCKKSFHYTCGYENSCNFQFVGKFESYCPAHKPRNNIPLANIEDSACPICLCTVELENPEPHEHPILPPCCKKAVFHRKCLLTTASSSGYFFKCPLCNDKQIFVPAMQMAGVYVPQMDAAWERDQNAFADQQYQYSTCDADECLCPNGRNHHEKETMWNLSRCGGCGAAAMHKECGQLPCFSWKCPTCQAVLAGSGILSSQSSEDTDADANSSQNTPQSSSRRSRISRPDFYDDNDYRSASEDEEIVENVVEILQCEQSVEELESETTTPRVPNSLRFNHMMDPRRSLMYDGIYQKSYKVEGGRGPRNMKDSQLAIVNDGQTSSHFKSESNSEDFSNVSGIITRNSEVSSCRVRKIPNSTVLVAADINSLRDANFHEKLAELKTYRQQMISNEKNIDADETQRNEFSLGETEYPLRVGKSTLDFVSTSKINRRKLDFAAKHASLPTIHSQNSESLQLGHETLLSDINADDYFCDSTSMLPTEQIPTQSNASPELGSRSNYCSPSSSDDTIKPKNRPILLSAETFKIDETLPTRVTIPNPSQTQNDNFQAIKQHSPNDTIDIIDLSDEQEDDDIQICEYIPSKPSIKILSVTSLQQEAYVPKSAAFMSMLQRFKEHQSRPWSSGGVSKESGFTLKSSSGVIEEVVLSESDEDDLQVLEVFDKPFKQEQDNNGNENPQNGDQYEFPEGKTSREWLNSSLDNNTKRPRLSQD